MKTKVNDYKLQELAFKCLSRILKNWKLYPKFRCFVGNGSLNRDMTSTIYSNLKGVRRYVEIARKGKDNNPFYYTKTKEDIFRILNDMVKNEDGSAMKENETAEIQMRLTQYINILLHHCLERVILDLNMIQNIGRETFEMACKILFGDDFVDETEKNIPDNIKKMMQAQNMFMRANNIEDPREILGNESFINSLRECVERLQMTTRTNDIRYTLRNSTDDFDWGLY